VIPVYGNEQDKNSPGFVGTNESFSLDVSDLNLLLFSTFLLGPNTWKTRRMVLAVYRIIHHLPAHGQQYIVESVGHIQTGAVQQDDILVSTLECIWVSSTEPACDDGHVRVPEQ
jgi:hypothetical protein